MVSISNLYSCIRNNAFKEMTVYCFIADHKSLTHQCYIS
ncbi:hypothetical protein BCAR13_580051 [Paraburkholderia caribensis]|nr:hypothetical protein BCAR13_580051 [Paraburkholderia caribensis]